ncbi:MAG: AAA family ATPase, partial [Bacteroidota bacterium]
MLLRLLIRNFALIGELELNVGPGLTVITGETGAGKSILLDAIGLLLGDQADLGSFQDSNLRCVVEMEFRSHDLEVLALWSEINNEEPPSANFEFILRREISPQRRSRCLIN